MNYGLIAEKVSHSFSAEIHKKLFGYDYQLTELQPSQLEEFLKSRNFKAINVTIPYKEAVIPHIDYVNQIAKEIGAVNTIVNQNGELFGYNTDYMGMIALINHCKVEINGKKVLVLGSGGTSKTACFVADYLKCSSVFRCSRTACEDCISYEDAKKYHSDVQIIINTTPCGMYPNIHESPIDISTFDCLEAVIDAVYNPLRSKLVCDALERGINAEGGLYMLVAQAAFAAELFVNKKVDESRINEIYKELCAEKQNIVLVGMPGCGKSSTGKYIANLSKKRFVDTDKLIAEKLGVSPAEIIEKQGEKAFRDIENAIIKEISKEQGLVVSTGGGAVLRKENIELLRENGRIYFIDRPIDDIVTTSDRPLSSDRELLEKRYAERYNIYLASCHKRIIPKDGIELNSQMILEDFHNEIFGN